MSNKLKYILIPVNGEPEVVELDGATVPYDALVENIEGWLECVTVDDDKTMWVDEEGKLNGLPVNHQATLLWEQSYGFTDVIVGPAVVSGGTDENGDTLGLTDVEVSEVLEAIR